MLTNLLRPSAGKQTHDFDAKRQLLTDQSSSHEPCRSWSTISLLATMDQVARSRAVRPDGVPYLLRSIHGTTVLALLSERGLDPHKVLSLSFGRQIRLSLDATLSRAVQEGSRVAGNAAAWIKLRKSFSEDQVGLSEAFRAKVRSWIETSEPADVLHWTPPTKDQWKKFPARTESITEEAEYRWIVERLTQTFLADWSDPSLNLEYRYINEGWRPSEVPSELALERRVRSEALNAELASRQVRGYELDVDTVAALIDQAREAIEDGNRSAAAGLFRSALKLDPSSGLITNNLAFCLIPDDPSSALLLLDKANELDGPTVLSEANKAAIYLLQDQPSLALEACERGNEIGLTVAGRAWLWQLPFDGEPTVSLVHSGVYLSRLAVTAAHAIHNGDLEQKWLVRLERLNQQLNA